MTSNLVPNPGNYQYLPDRELPGTNQPPNPQNPRSNPLFLVPKNRELPRNYGNCRSSQFPHPVWELGTAPPNRGAMNA